MLGKDEYMHRNELYYGVFEESGLKRVDLPSTLKRIEYSAFKHCYNLQNIRLPDSIEYIGKECFSGSNLEEVIFPKSTKTVAIAAFKNCKRLLRAELNEGLEVLGQTWKSSGKKS